MARIAGVDLPREKRVEIGLTYIFGIGRSTSQKILAICGIDPNTRVSDLTERMKLTGCAKSLRTSLWSKVTYGVT